MTLATMTSKGQITIPKEIRDSLKLSTGDKIEFILTNSREALLRPVSKKVDEVFGRLYQPNRNPASIEEMNAAIAKRIRARIK